MLFEIYLVKKKKKKKKTSYSMHHIRGSHKKYFFFSLEITNTNIGIVTLWFDDDGYFILKYILVKCICILDLY